MRLRKAVIGGCFPHMYWFFGKRPEVSKSFV